MKFASAVHAVHRFVKQIAIAKKKNIFSEYAGTQAVVLVENKKGGYLFGHTENFMPVAISQPAVPGEFVKVKLSNSFEHISDELSIIIN